MITLFIERSDHVKAIAHTAAILLEGLEPLQVRSYAATDSPMGEVSVSYGARQPDKHMPRHVHIQEDPRLWAHYGRAASAPPESCGELSASDENGVDRHVPIIYGAGGCITEHESATGRVVTIEADIVASAYFLLTRYEELLADDADGLFCRVPDWLIRHNCSDRPLVDEYREILEHALVTRLGVHPESSPPKPAILLTHDIDWLRKHESLKLSAKAAAISAIAYGRPLQAVRDLAEIVPVRLKMRNDPYLAAIDWLMDSSEQYGWTSHMFFMAGGHTRHDGYYQPTHRLLPEVLRKIINRGHRAGLHPSYDTCNNLELMESEKRALEGVAGVRIAGGRQHFLRFKTPDTWRNYVSCGMVYDSSLGYSGRNGFRCGTCHPFQVFDPVEETPLPLIEYPLIVMDVNITHHRNWSAAQMVEEILRYARLVHQHRGVLTLLRHNSQCTPFARKAYESALSKIAALGFDPIVLPEDAETRLERMVARLRIT